MGFNFIGFQYIDYFNPALFFTDGVGHLALFFTGHRLTLYYFLQVALDTLHYFLQVIG